MKSNHLFFGSLLVLALASALVLAFSLQATQPLSNETTSTVSESTQIQTAELIPPPCPEQDAMLVSREKADATNIAMFGYVCGSSHSTGTFCSDPSVPTLDQYNYCESVTCGATTKEVPAGGQTRVYTHTEKNCPCGTCVYALTGLTVSESNIAYTRLRDNLRCRDGFTPTLPPSCGGIGISLETVLNTRPGAPLACVFAVTSAAGGCSTSGNVACPPDPIQNAPNCTPTGATPPVPTNECINDIVAQEIANGNCWTV